MSAEDEANVPDEVDLMLEATFKTWDFLEKNGFEVDELTGKDVSFIVQTPDGGGCRLGINNLMREIDEASSAGEALEVCYLQAVVSDSKDGLPNPFWDDAEFPVCQPPPPRSEKVAAKAPKIEACFFPRHGPPFFVKLPFSGPKVPLPPPPQALGLCRSVFKPLAVSLGLFVSALLCAVLFLWVA